MSTHDNQKGQKSGPWSRAERKYIAENCDLLDYDEIARNLRRNESSVRDYITEKLGKRVAISKKLGINPEYDIQRSPIWKELQKEFTSEELDIFLYHWSRIINQFKDDVFPTEELQVVDYIKLELLAHRSLQHIRFSMNSIEELEGRIAALNKQEDMPQRNIELAELHRLVGAHRQAVATLTEEHSKLLGRKENLLKELKGTRAERIKRIESSKETLIGWITELLRNRPLRTQMGYKMEKMRIAIDLEKVRLMEPYKYSDGIIDYPRLTAETMEQVKGQKE